MKKKLLSKVLAICLCFALAFVFTPMLPFMDGIALAAESSFIDMPSDWSTAALEHAVANGLLKGYDVAAGAEIRATGNITRAEMATVVNRAFGAKDEASLSGVADVASGKWYASEIAKAVGMQTMTKAANMRPDDKVTRQEAFTILARAYRQAGGSKADLAKFSDSTSVASWAVDGLGALVKAGYVSGNGATLNPTGYMTRAEFAKIMNNLTAAYVNTTEKYSKDVKGNVIVNVAGAKLENMKIIGDLIIAEGVGEGDVDINNVQISGNIIVKAGGENSIHIANVTLGGTLVVNKIGGTVRIVASGTTTVSMVQVGSDVIITATDLNGGEIGTVKIDGAEVKDVVLRGDFKAVESSVKDVKIAASEGKIETFTMNEKATVTGTSEIKKVKNDTNETITVNNKDVEAGKSTSIGATGTPAATGGSTGGGSSSSGGSGSSGGSSSSGGSTGGSGGSSTSGGSQTAAETAHFAAGYPILDVANNQVKIKMADATHSEVFGIVNKVNSETDCTSDSVMKGFARDNAGESVLADDILYLEVSDTEEHILDFEVMSDPSESMYAAFVVKRGDDVTTTPVKVTASLQVLQEIDEYEPFVLSAFVNAAKNKIYVYLDEEVTITNGTKDEFSIGDGATIDSAALVQGDGVRHHGSIIELAVSDYGDASRTLSYDGSSVKDTSSNENELVYFDDIEIGTAGVTVGTAIASNDMKHLIIQTQNSFVSSRSPQIEIRYGVDWESAVELPDNSYSIGSMWRSDGSAVTYYVDVENLPTLQAGNSYFAKINCDNLKNYAFDSQVGDITCQITNLPSVADPTPTAKYDLSEETLIVDFGISSIYGSTYPHGSYLGPLCRFEITTADGKVYNLRGVEADIKDNKIKIESRAFPFTLSTFNWEGAKLSYSNSIEPGQGTGSELHNGSSGNDYKGFSNVNIIVE